ncbi:Ldh family oxidoreductase [Dyella acidiphila]|uniref:Ldh family oxidoreductase n=1 Tax=Dyella acidiphila TaxID=2775866 RepID=A0ABR9GD81_9GAMM|nr:Ldh family oxidoreductase [Dyella acidiphila]MBE1162004.1 Ldh family oxidoreductase [Dyella acidiphila]
MQRYDAAQVHAAMVALLMDLNVSEAHATDVADALVDASLRGIDTHGVRLIHSYIKELEGGRAQAKPNFRVTGSLPAAALFDGGDALGVVAGSAAMREAIRRARIAGIAAIAVSHSNHFGRADYFARMASAAGQIGLVFSNSDALVVPFGGATPLNGTNPLAMAAPGHDGDGFYLDMATSQTAYSRVLHALHHGLPVAPGLATNQQGQDLSQGGELGALQPLGGVKGQGLGMMIQILCALLSNMPFDVELSNLYREPYDTPRLISHFMVAIEISAFVDLDVFRSRLSELLTLFRESKASGAEPVRVPGDLEREAEAERRLDGIPLTAEDVELLGRHLSRVRDSVVTAI